MASQGPVVNQAWEDGHKLITEKWQYLLLHPMNCKNAKGKFGGTPPAKRTFFHSFKYLESELADCKLSLNIAPKASVEAVAHQTIKQCS